MATNPFDQFDAPVAANPFDQFDDKPAVEPAGAVRKLADLGISALRGAVAVPEAAVGLADIATGGRAGKVAEGLGFRPKEAKDILAGWYSDDLRAKQQQFEHADGVLDKAAVAVTNPSLIANAAVESVPQMLGGGAVARGALKLAPAVGPVIAGAAGEGLIGAGSQAEQVRQQSTDGLLTPQQAALAAASGAATGAIGFAGGKVAQKLGIGDVDTLIAGGTTQVAGAAARGAPKGAVRRAAEGAASEGLLEELPQGVVQQGLQNIALDRPFMEDQAGNAVMGTLTGGLMGAGAGAISRPPVEVAPAPAALPAGPVGRAAATALNLGIQPLPVVDEETGEVAAPAVAAPPAPVGPPADLNSPLTAAVQRMPGGQVHQVTDEEDRAGTQGIEVTDIAPEAISIGPELQRDTEDVPRAGVEGITATEIQPAADRATFPTIDAATTYVRQQRANGTNLTAAPFTQPDGSIVLAINGSPEYETALDQRRDRLAAEKGTTKKAANGTSDAVPAVAGRAAAGGRDNAGGSVAPVLGGRGESVSTSQPIAADGAGAPGRVIPFGKPSPALIAQREKRQKAIREANAAERQAAAAPAPPAPSAIETVASAPTGSQSPDAGKMVEHVTGKGKTLRGVVRADITLDDARAIDAGSFTKDGGVFIRERSLDALKAFDAKRGTTAPDATAAPKGTVETPAPSQRETAPRAAVETKAQGPELLPVTDVYQWVREGKPQDARTHSTQPSAQDLKAGPFARVDAQAAEQVQYTEPRADGKPFPNAPARGAAPAAVAPEPIPTAAPAAAVSANTIFTEDAAEKARARLKSKLGRLNSGIDPETLMDGITLAGYHIERGARTFTAYAKAMLADLGDGARPFLKSFYLGVKFDPRGAFDAMDSAGAVEAIDVDAIATEPDAADTGAPNDRNAARELDRPSPGPLDRAPTQEVQAPSEDGQTRSGADRSGNRDGRGDARTDDAGRDAAGSVGSDARVVPVPARGARADAKDAEKPRVSRARRVDAGPVEPGDARGGLTPEGGANQAPNAPPIAAPQIKASDFTIEDDFAIGEGGQKTKFKGNVAAIRLLNDIEASGRLATPDEQKVLAKYVGWGGLPQAFDSNNAEWSKEHAELTALLSAEDLAAARKSTRYAHYTSRPIIVDGIYAALRRFGFTGGKTLEAGAGVGNFIGLMPADMRSAGRFTAVERDPTSAAIARHLYPQQNVLRGDFTEFKGTDAFYDAAVGNPPFASDPQTDRSGRKHLSGLSLHNYFFAKNVDMLREGGLMAQVVTSSFLDAKTDTARKYIGERTRFLGAIRLPNSAFAKNANTEVTTDIIFLQKLGDAEIGGRAARADAKRWLDTVAYTDKNGRELPVNRYFSENPDMMLGDFGAFGTMYGPNQPALVARAGQDTLALLQAAVGRLPEKVYQSAAEQGTANLTSAAIVALKNPPVNEGGYFMEGDKLIQRQTDLGGEARGVEITPASMWTAKTTLGEAGFERIKALSSMRSTLRGLLAAEMADDDRGMGELRAKLNEQYDAYSAAHGLINDPATLRVFDDDPDFPLLASLEHSYVPAIGLAAAKRMGIKMAKSTAAKSPIFDRRVVAARARIAKASTPEDALAISMAERGKLDTAYIGELLGMEPEAVLRALSTGDKPQLFLDPATDEYVLRDAYLSGNVRAKLAQARSAAMFDNAKALEAVQPADVGAHEISARIGSPWVPEAVYADFARSLFGEGTEAQVSYVKLNSSFQIHVKAGNQVALTNTWGTPAVHGDELLHALLNNRPIKVTYRDSEGKTHTNVEATEAANNKAAEIKERFQDWLFNDADRSELLTRAYNETNNNYVTRQYDGSMMTFPGKVPDEIIRFRRHQRNAIARIVQDRTALLDHIVGSGKTFSVVASAMELKRTGLAKKPMVAVPNHLVKQWAADFYRLYPGANILTATKKDFEKANRRKFLARIATSDWDAVVIAHSSFGFIQPAPEFEAAFNDKQIAAIVAQIDMVENADGDKQAKRRTVKQLEALKEKIDNRIKSLRDKPMDDLLDFQQIGVDQLFVDEAHMFKNLMFSTKMQGVQGLGDAAGSQRAYDMYVKASQIYEQNGRGQGVVFATGTPVSNSLAEMYHMMRYLMPEQMKELGFESFDAWANTFASVEQVWMQKPSGDGFKASNRMSKFVNTTELLKMFDQVSDTVTMDDIKAAYRDENDGAEFPLPKLKGDRRTPVSLDKSDAQNDYMAEIANRARAVEARRGPPKKGDDNVLVIMGDARKAAMDIRLVDPDITEREIGGRIGRAADETLARYRKYDKWKGTQLVFSDLGTPLRHARAELREYEALQAAIEAGNADVAASAAMGNDAAAGVMEDAEEAQATLDAKGADWLGAVKAALRGFSVYDDLRAALVEKGIPEAEIAFIHDYNTDEQKAGLFRKVNSGQIRVLLGSTAKMGAGTNVQERLVAEHHLDVPWRPSDVEQREGRIIRQGNKLMDEIPGFEVEILAYVTKDTLDMRMWQVQETKLKMINQLRTRKISREIDNAFEDMELSAGEMQAAATGNMELLTEIQLRTDIKKLEQRRRSFDAGRNDLASRKKRNAERLARLPGEAEEAAAEAQHAKTYLLTLEKANEDFSLTIDGTTYTERPAAQAVLGAMVDAKVESKDLAGTVTLKAAPISVNIGGEDITSRAALHEAYSEAAGDAKPIRWAFNGNEYKRRTALANALRRNVLDAMADETTKPLGTIGGYEVAVEGSVDKHGNVLDVTLSRGGAVVLSNDIRATNSNTAPEQVVRAVENQIEGAISRARHTRDDLAAAKKEKTDLDATPKQQQGEWPDQGKLDAARAKHKEVLARLNAKAPGAVVPPADAPAAPADDAPAFSRSTAFTPAARAQATAAVERLANDIAAKWTNAPKIVVAFDMGDPVIPENVRSADVQQRSGGAGTPEGIYYRGTVYLMASKLRTPADTARVLFHEALGHAGLRAVFGDTLKPILQHIALFRKADVDAKMKEYGLRGVDSIDRLAAAEEVLAELAQTRPEIGIVQRAIAAVRTWLRANVPSFANLNLTDAEIVRNYLAPARGFVERGGATARATGDSAIRYSLDGGAGTEPLRARAVEAVNATFNTPGKVGWWHKTVGTPYNLAQRHPEFKRVFDSVQDFIGDVSKYATEAANLAPKILPQLYTIRDLAKQPITAADSKAIAAPIFEGTLAWARDERGEPIKLAALEDRFKDLSPKQKGDMLMVKRHITEQQLKSWQGLPIDSYEGAIANAFEEKFLTPGVVWTNSELRNIFKLTGDAATGQIGLYREFRESIDKSLAQLAVSDMLRFAGDDAQIMRAAAMDAPTVDAAAALLRDHLLEAAQHQPKRAEMLRDTADKIMGKADRANELMERGYAPLSRFGKYSVDVVDADGERVYFGLFENRFEAAKMAKRMQGNFEGATITQGTMSQQAHKLFAGVTPETLELFGEMLNLEGQSDDGASQAFQQYLKMAKTNRSAMKRLIQRKGIAGFSEDPGRVLAGFVYSNARQTAGNLHAGEIKQSAAAVAKESGELKDAAINLTNYISNPQEEAAGLRGLLFTQYLGGSIASALVNLTQPLQTTFPYLSQFGGVATAANQVRRAMADARKGKTIDEGLDKALKQAEETGLVAPQEVHYLMAQAAGTASLSAGDGTRMGELRAEAGNYFAKFQLAWGKLFSTAEQFNRRVTFIAAYRTAVAQNMPNPSAFAAKAIAETQFVANKGNRPEWARGAIGSTLFTFKSYSVNYVELLARMATAGEPGSPERAAGQRAAVVAIAMLFLVGGAGGLPFAEDLADLADALMQRLGYNWNTKQKRQEMFETVFGRAAAQFVERGISGIGGVPLDVSGRLGMGNLIPGTGLLTVKADHKRDVAELFGPAGDLVKRGFESADSLLDAKPVNAFFGIAPKAIGNLRQGVDMATSGFYKDTKGRKVVDTDAYDAAIKAIGFQPNDVARVQSATSDEQNAIAQNRLRSSQIMNMWAAGIAQKDHDMVREAKDDLMRWNANNPTAPISINMSSILKKARTLLTPKEERIAATAPKAMRQEVRNRLNEELR